MTCQARTSYTEDEVLWGHRFFPVISLEEGFFKVDYSQFHATFEVPTTPYSVKEQEEALLLSSPLMAPSLCNSGEKNSSLDCLETLEDNDSTTKLPTKLQKITGREGLPKKLLRMSSTTSEMTYSFGDLPMKLQRISSVPGVFDDKHGGKASKMSTEPMSKSVADLPPKLQRLAGGGRGQDGRTPTAQTQKDEFRSLYIKQATYFNFCLPPLFPPSWSPCTIPNLLTNNILILKEM